jgi:hypothetical protein
VIFLESGLAGGLLVVIALVVFLVIKCLKPKTEDPGIAGGLTEDPGRKRGPQGSSAHEMDVDLAAINENRFSARLGTLAGMDKAREEIWV